MKKPLGFLLGFCIVLSCLGAAFTIRAAEADLKLENPPDAFKVDLMDALKQRHSTREFSSEVIPIRDLSTVLWAANGVNRTNNQRTAPSAYGKYFIDLYVASHQGFYKYDPVGNLLKWVSGSDIRGRVGKQGDIGTASHVLIMVADLRAFPIFVGREERLTMAHGTAGTIAQNVYLAAAALKIGTRMVGNIQEKAIREELKLTSDQQVPLYIMPLGFPKQR